MSLVPTSTPFTHYRLLTFDIYGTLIDWETGISAALLSTPHISSLPPTHPFKAGAPHKALLHAFDAHEQPLQKAHPTMLYPEVLSTTYIHLIRELVSKGDISASDASESSVRQAGETVGASIGSWAAFPDTVAAMQTLGKYYKLAPISNVDNASLRATMAGGLNGVPFSALYTAEDIGSYKPDLRNFEYVFKQAAEDFPDLFGFKGGESEEERREVVKSEILHVAVGVWHDHMPAKELGLESVYVDRKGVLEEVVEEKVLRERCRWNWRVNSVGELAGMVEEAFGKGGE